MARRRRTRRLRAGAAFVVVLAVVWFFAWPRPANDDGSPDKQIKEAQQAPVVAKPVDLSVTKPEPPPTVPTNVANAAPVDSVPTPQRVPPKQPTPSETNGRATDHVEKGRAAESSGEILIAREQFNRALELGLPRSLEREVRQHLYDLASRTVFSAKRVTGDPLTKTHVVAKGETLERIARTHRVTAGFLAEVNRIRNINLIREKQRLKVVNGPFHAVVDKSDYTMGIYLQDVLVREYRVGLGADDSTPLGKWRVKAGSKLKNPTYFPPRGGDIIAADDPENPLGEHWLGLEGVEGDAVGQERYGIHGTIEPNSIGTSTSMGCVRMRNDDVAEVFDLLVPTHSYVTVRP